MEKWEKDLELRNILMDTFNDTVALSESNERLRQSVERSVMSQRIYYDTDDCAAGHPVKGGNVIVSRKHTLEAAAGYKGKRIAVLNFASALAPGGTGHKAALTQEECLCRESTLYSCINNEQCLEGFYHRHSHDDRMYNADMIYTPDVTVFKTYDKIPVLMSERDWFDVDIITMAAPDISLMKNKPSDDAILRVFEERFIHIMNRALEHDAEVLILGAFGCGMFGNDPAVVATAAARALDKIWNRFDTVEFAIYEGQKKKCFRMFRLVMDRYRPFEWNIEPGMGG